MPKLLLDWQILHLFNYKGFDYTEIYGFQYQTIT